MKPEITDPRRTLEYGHSHDLARSFLPVTLVGVALGLFLMTPFDRAVADRSQALLGGAVVALALAFLGVVIYRRAQPNVPSIVLSPQGILFRDISASVIPWDEIREVGTAHVKASKELFSTKVTKIVVSQRYYDALSGGTWRASTIAQGGDPSEIYLSHFHTLPFEEFQDAVRHRWQAFSRHAQGHAPQEAHADSHAIRPHDDRPRAVAAPQPTARGGGVVQRAASFPGLRALSAIIAGSSPGQLVANAAAVAAILALLTNQIGLWSTPQQDRARTAAAKWRAELEKFNADRKATDDDQRRIREMWDRKYKCMNEYWALHERGIYTKDPACMKDDK